MERAHRRVSSARSHIIHIALALLLFMCRVSAKAALSPINGNNSSLNLNREIDFGTEIRESRQPLASVLQSMQNAKLEENILKLRQDKKLREDRKLKEDNNLKVKQKVLKAREEKNILKVREEKPKLRKLRDDAIPGRLIPPIFSGGPDPGPQPPDRRPQGPNRNPPPLNQPINQPQDKPPPKPVPDKPPPAQPQRAPPPEMQKSNLEPPPVNQEERPIPDTRESPPTQKTSRTGKISIVTVTLGSAAVIAAGLGFYVIKKKGKIAPSDRFKRRLNKSGDMGLPWKDDVVIDPVTGEVFAPSKEPPPPLNRQNKPNFPGSQQYSEAFSPEYATFETTGTMDDIPDVKVSSFSRSQNRDVYSNMEPEIPEHAAQWANTSTSPVRPPGPITEDKLDTQQYFPEPPKESSPKKKKPKQPRKEERHHRHHHSPSAKSNNTQV